MRLYLSSFGLGGRPDALVALAPGGRVGLVMNALDNRPAARASWAVRQRAALAALGFAVTELDLRDAFLSPGRLAEALADLDAIWINGGNVFVLRRAMALSGFDRLVPSLVRRDALVYADFSAAVVVAAPTLRGLDLVDDPADVPAGYPPEIFWDGLGLVPFATVVHHRSDHPEAAGTARELAFFEREGIPYRTLRDGEAFVVDGDIATLRVVGGPDGAAG